MTKKKVFVLALAICLVATLSFGTLAWFTDTDSVDNQFNVTTSEAVGKPDFRIELFESEVDPETGLIGDGDDENTTIDEVKANTYNNVMPGATLTKDPTVRNSGDFNQWVRVKVTFSDYAIWKTVMGDDYDLTTVLNGIDAAAWTKADKAETGTDTITYTYYLNFELIPSATQKLFSSITIPGDFEVDNIFANFELNIVAEAIQSANTGATAQEAFANHWND